MEIEPRLRSSTYTYIYIQMIYNTHNVKKMIETEARKSVYAPLAYGTLYSYLVLRVVHYLCNFFVTPYFLAFLVGRQE